MGGNESILDLVKVLPKEFSDVVETGTFLGDTTRKFSEVMHWVHTIELDERLYEYTKSRLIEEGSRNISCYLGNSAEVLPIIIKDYNDNHPAKKVIFFLDAHWSGDESITEYKNGYSGPRTWIGNFTGHLGNGDNPSSKEQIPLEEEIMHIYDNFQNECMIVIDDLDKFDENGVGMAGLCFDEEDWSCVNLKSVVKSIEPRILHPIKEYNDRLIIRLKGKNEI